MYKLVTIILGALSLCGCIGSGSNTEIVARENYFPGLSGINLQGTVVKIPDELSGELNLIVTAYVRSQQTEVDTWIDHLSELRRQHPQLSFYEMPIIYTGSAMFRFYVNNGMRSGIRDEEQRRAVITVYTEVADFCKAVALPDTRQIAVFLVRRDGRIVGRTLGPYTPEKAADLFVKVPSGK